MGGELNAAITSALVGIHNEYLGRGPKSASTFHHGNVLVTLMRDVLTPAERSLAGGNRREEVSHVRHLFQETMEADFREAVERLTGRKVLAFISGNQFHPDIAAELFILDGHHEAGRSPIAARMSEAPPRRWRGTTGSRSGKVRMEHPTWGVMVECGRARPPRWRRRSVWTRVRSGEGA